MQTGPRKRIFLLIIIMTVIVIAVESISMGILYRTAINEERLRLVEIAKSQARLIEAIARFDKTYSNDYPFGARATTLNKRATGKRTLSRAESRPLKKTGYAVEINWT